MQLFWNLNRILTFTCIVSSSLLALIAENGNISYAQSSSSSSSLSPETNLGSNATNLSSNESPSAASILANATTGKTRTHYIAADEVIWNYTSSREINNITGEPFTDKERMLVMPGPQQIGSTYLKSQYREYTDDTFTELKPIPPEWGHLGILGPVVRGEVGDTIKIVFKNNLDFAVSMHPHGVFYLKDSEGAPTNDGTSGGNKSDDSVMPGQTQVYTWPVPERAGPGPNDPSSIAWQYHSHTSETRDENAGLIGPIIIARKGMANPDGSPKDVDREFVALFKNFNETQSPYLEDNIEQFAQEPSTVDTENPIFKMSNIKHSINGFLFGYMPGLVMEQGERVRWYTMGMGGEMDLHTPHWHGNTLLQDGRRVDVTELLPASVKTLDMIPDNPGTWMYHCHVTEHIDMGMQVLYTVTPAAAAAPSDVT